MPGCSLPEYVGREVAVEYALACGDVDPVSLAFKRIGAMTTKGFSLTWDTTELSTDAGSPTPGTPEAAATIINALRTNLATFKNFTVTGDGLARRKDDAWSNLIELTKHVGNPGLGFNGQPVAWIRLTFPDLTFICYCIINDLGRGAPTDTAVTFSFGAMATSSPFGLIINDTPQLVEPTAIAVTPTPLELEVGEVQPLSVRVTPPAALQAVNWTSSDPFVATVSSAGVVTAQAPGSAAITARSPIASAVFGTSQVTVIEP